MASTIRKYVFLKIIKNYNKMKQTIKFLMAFMFVVGSSFCAKAEASDDATIAKKNKDARRIMCYNVRNCRGEDDVLDYDRVAKVMKSVGAEVIAVQELDSATGRSKGTVALEELAKRLKMKSTYGAAIDYDGGKYGVGLLSVEKPISYTTMPLPGANERRVLLLVEFKDYYFAVTHLSLTNDERVQSVNMIIDAVKDIKNKPLFIAGDFNATPTSDPIKLMSSKFTVLNDINEFTIPVVNPNRTIDFIFGYNNGYKFDVTQRKVIQEKYASDHLPLFVDVIIKK